MSDCDALVIGGGVSGLTAAAYLARAGLRVIVAEARNKLGGACESMSFGEGFHAPLTQTLYALDPRVVKDLKLNLKFAVRDMALTGLRADGKHIVLSRDGAARSIAVHSQADAKAWKRFRRELFSLARDMRALWWDEGTFSVSRERLEPFRRLSAAAWLDGWFESDALKATLAFDATENGLSPFEPGSALALLWRASQEMCGLQGAVAALAGGPPSLVQALLEAAKVDIRTGANVSRILLANGAVAGVELASGETIAASIVISSASRRRTLNELLPTGAIGFARADSMDRANPKTGTAKVALALSALPMFAGVPSTARFILAERLESYAAAYSAARAGRLPDELIMEAVTPTAADSSLAPIGQHLLIASVRPVPLAMNDEMKAQLTAKVIAAFARHVPGMHVVASEVLTPAEISSRYGAQDLKMNVAQMLANWDERLRTPISSLMLCGESAISGRAGRIAAAMAIRDKT
ncbi:MAG TPA: NAD(P)/FAD-dependent oxidoreductase [Rhizomicrobium sp.]|nr:NAD(P)/FAD-dependent oxidoreductase [Rhizomicrobium sp.]